LNFAMLRRRMYSIERAHSAGWFERSQR